MKLFERVPRYHIYLLTIWEEQGPEPGAAPVWRFRLEDPSTGNRHGFADLGALATALEEVLSSRNSAEN